MTIDAERIEQKIRSLLNWAARHRFNATSLESMSKQLRKQGETSEPYRKDLILSQADRISENAKESLRKAESLEGKISNLREKMAQMVNDSG